MNKGRVLTSFSSQPSTALHALASWPFQAAGCPHGLSTRQDTGLPALEAGQAYGCAEVGNSVLYSSWKVRSLNLRTARAAVRLCQERAGVRPAGKSWQGQRYQQGDRLQWARGHLSVRLSDPPLKVRCPITHAGTVPLPGGSQPSPLLKRSVNTHHAATVVGDPLPSKGLPSPRDCPRWQWQQCPSSGGSPPAVSLEEGSSMESLARLGPAGPAEWAGGRYTHPREDGEEGEGDGGPGRVRPFVQRVVLGLGDLPLVGQVAETHEPEEGPEGWVSTRVRRTVDGGRGNRGTGRSSSVYLPCSPTPKGGAERGAQGR